MEKRPSPQQKKKPKLQRSSAGKDRPTMSWGDEIWPIERDVFFRPERYKYIRKLIKPKGCVFCHASEKSPSYSTLCIYQTQHSMVLLNKFPYNSGHLLILPRKHCGEFLQLSSEEYMDLHWTLYKSIEILKKVYHPEGMNVGLNLGQAGGAGIPKHIHYHLIPRWSGDLNFFPLIAETKVVIETLKQSYSRFKPHF